jgi:5-(carboxyamino)imidazole ribonucleotide synthase
MIENLKIGILGGGQLGKMLIQASLDLDLDIAALDPDPMCPCRQISKFSNGDLNDFDTVYNFGKDKDLLTIEIENVNIEALKKLENEGVKVYPQPAVLAVIKDKIQQKKFYKSKNIPTADFEVVNSKFEISRHQQRFPLVNKIATGGYDGRGVQMLRKVEDLEKAFDAPGILEELISFKKELAVIVARSVSGEIKTFPTVEMVFHPEANLVEYLFAPAELSEIIDLEAQKIAKSVAEAFEIVGLLAVEMFLGPDDKIYVNEVAPRPHNSGHHTLRANHCSQYDQHWRAILDLPLENTESIKPAAMVNILGADGYEGAVKIEGLKNILEKTDVFPYFYGKKTTRPFRKMGHVTILDNSVAGLKSKVEYVKSNLIIRSN